MFWLNLKKIFRPDLLAMLVLMFFLAGLQFGLLVNFQYWAGLNFLLVALVFLTVFAKDVNAIIGVIAIGFLLDLFSTMAFGFNLLLVFGIFLLLRWLYINFFNNISVLSIAFLISLTFFSYYLLHYFINLILYQFNWTNFGYNLADYLAYALNGLVVNLVFGLLVFFILERFFKLTQIYGPKKF